MYISLFLLRLTDGQFEIFDKFGSGKGGMPGMPSPAEESEVSSLDEVEASDGDQMRWPIPGDFSGFGLQKNQKKTIFLDKIDDYFGILDVSFSPFCWKCLFVTR